jgi:hypothetical protein
MELDPVILSPLQFLWVIAWHILVRHRNRPLTVGSQET